MQMAERYGGKISASMMKILWTLKVLKQLSSILGRVRPDVVLWLVPSFFRESINHDTHTSQRQTRINLTKQPESF
jgi:hypothetical protein